MTKEHFTLLDGFTLICLTKGDKYIQGAAINSQHL
jgi:hypothetical protein